MQSDAWRHAGCCVHGVGKTSRLCCGAAVGSVGACAALEQKVIAATFHMVSNDNRLWWHIAIVFSTCNTWSTCHCWAMGTLLGTLPRNCPKPVPMI